MSTLATTEPVYEGELEDIESETGALSRAARVWSPLQTAVFDDVRSGEGHTVVRARAGTGKSATAEEAALAHCRGKRTMYVCFNRTIMLEMKLRLPDTWVTTAHALGYRAVMKEWPDCEMVKNDKTKILLSDSGMSRQRVTQLRNAVSLAKGVLANTPEDIGHLLARFRVAYDAPLTDRGDVIADKREAKDLFVKDTLSLLERHAETTAIVDFDDMVWLPLRHRLWVGKRDLVFIDETQDFNASQLALARKVAAAPGSRIIAIGDDRQAIYGFRGADRNAVQFIIDRLSAKVLPLSITYRCGKAIVALVQGIVPDFEAFDQNPEGLIDSAGFDEMVAGAKPGDFILSRTNAPLLKACIRLLRRGTPATIAGRDVGEGLVMLVENSRCGSIRTFATWLGKWREKEITRLIALDAEADLSAIHDQYECMQALMEGVDDIAGLIARIQSLFSEKDDKNRVVCSSTHKAKGLERDHVWLLRDTYLKRNDTEEQNLYYVACTRARLHLTMVYEERCRGRLHR